MKDILDNFGGGNQQIKTQWFSVFSFGLIFMLYIYIKCHLFLKYWMTMNSSPDVISIGIILMIISTPMDSAMAILFLRKKYLESHNVPMFMTSCIYLTFAYSFVAIKPYMISFSNFSDLFDIVGFIQPISLIFLYSIPVSIISILLVNFISKKYLQQ